MVSDSTSVRSKTGTKGVKILCSCCVDKIFPGFLAGELGNALPVYNSALCAVDGLVTGLVTELTLLRRAVTSRMALNAAGVAGTSERTLDFWVGAVSLVVSDLTTVVAFAR